MIVAVVTRVHRLRLIGVRAMVGLVALFGAVVVVLLWRVLRARGRGGTADRRLDVWFRTRLLRLFGLTLASVLLSVRCGSEQIFIDLQRARRTVAVGPVLGHFFTLVLAHRRVFFAAARTRGKLFVILSIRINALKDIRQRLNLTSIGVKLT